MKPLSSRRIQVRHFYCHIIGAYLLHAAVFDKICLAVEVFLPIDDGNIAAVIEYKEALTEAVLKGDILKKPAAVQQIVLNLIIVGEYLSLGESETGGEAYKTGVCTLTGQLRLNIDRVCGVHAACADSHDNAIEAAEQLTQTDADKKAALCWDMTAGEDYKLCFSTSAAASASLRPSRRVYSEKSKPVASKERLMA